MVEAANSAGWETLPISDRPAGNGHGFDSHYLHKRTYRT
jgi:hypothetical protein